MRKKGHTLRIILLLLCIEILAVVVILAYVQLRPMVVKAVTIEAGTDVPGVEEFLLYKNREGSFVTNVQELTEPGTYEVQIKIGNKIHKSSLQIIDTVAPVATVTDQIVLRDEVVEPLSFIHEVIDASDVTVTFKETPDTTIPGDKQVTLVLEDQGGNTTEMAVALTVLDMKNNVTIEAGAPMNITVADFVEDGSYDVSFLTELATLDVSKTGTYEVKISVNGKEVTGSIEVVDTTPPQATLIPQTIWKDVTIPAQAFVDSITDASGVTVEYKTEPDFTLVGEQKVTLLLKDDSGNTTEQVATLNVEADTEAPKIMGTRDKTVYLGDGVAYRKDVYATDNKDAEPTVAVDSSDVNLKKVGVYKVIYTAMDAAGNKAEVITTVSVINFIVTQEMVDEKADKVIAKIITDKMDNLQKAEAIYHWIKKSVSYTGDSDKTDWLKEAYRAFEDGEGDCFTYYAVAQELLTRVGIENMQVTRLGGKTHHYWNLVDCGDGWYHFDSCPNKDHVETFMLTDQELDAFAATRGNYYYNRDKTLYPATSEVSIQSKVLK